MVEHDTVDALGRDAGLRTHRAPRPATRRRRAHGLPARLEEEQREFREFLNRLRTSKDRSEFDQFMSVHPYTQAQRVFLVVDNGSAHRGKRSIDRLQGTWPNLIVVHTPIHASWLNQAEIYFSVVQRKVVTPNDFADLDTLEQRLLAFGHRYEQIAQPFEWKFTRSDLTKLLERLTNKPDYQAAASAMAAAQNTTLAVIATDARVPTLETIARALARGLRPRVIRQRRRVGGTQRGRRGYCAHRSVQGD